MYSRPGLFKQLGVEYMAIVGMLRTTANLYGNLFVAYTLCICLSNVSVQCNSSMVNVIEILNRTVENSQIIVQSYTYYTRWLRGSICAFYVHLLLYSNALHVVLFERKTFLL